MQVPPDPFASVPGLLASFDVAYGRAVDDLHALRGLDQRLAVLAEEVGRQGRRPGDGGAPGHRRATVATSPLPPAHAERQTAASTPWHAASRMVAIVTIGGLAAMYGLGVGRPSPPQPLGSTDTRIADRGSVPTSTLALERTTASTEAPSSAPAPAPGSSRIAAPVAVRVPAIGVDSQVVVVGREPDGAMEIPSDVRTVGWYDPFAGAGVVPGERGTAVIAGHVDSRTQGRGAFWLLRDLAPGDVIEIAHADGSATRWQVDDVVRHPKTDIPIDDIFTFDGDERLALITCGGQFDRSLGAYLDNYVVMASRRDAPTVGRALLPRD